MSTRPGRVLAAAAGALALVAALAPPASASVALSPTPTHMTDKGVFAVAQVGTRTIIGGNFTRVGGRTRLGLAAIRADGTVDPGFNPGVNGKVEAIAATPDGSRIFIGGKFTEIGGVPRANLAALDASGAVVGAWRADTGGTNPLVTALVVRGDRVYVAGKYNGIDGSGRNKLAAIKVDTGDLAKPFNPKPNGGINEIALSPDGSTLYAGGGFTKIGGADRPTHVGAVSTVDGLATAFKPTVDGGLIPTIGITPDGTTLFASTDNNTVYALNTATSASRWSIKMSGNTQAMASDGTEVWLGGHFSQYLPTKTKRPYFASLNVSNGSLTSWHVNAEGGKMGVWDLELGSDGTLHSGGVFTFFNGVRQRGYARFAPA